MQRRHRIAPLTLLSVMAVMLALTVIARAAAADPRRVAIVFAADTDRETESARDIARDVGTALTHGRFIVIDPGAFPKSIPAFDAIPHFADWRAIRAEALMIGHLAHARDGRLRVEVRLWSTDSGMQMLGYRYLVGPNRLPELENIIVEAVSERLAPPVPPRLVHFPR